MLAPSAPQSFYLYEDSPHRRLRPSWEVMSGKVSVKTLAATQPNYHSASGLTLVRTSGRACSRTPSQIAQRCWIQAKMVQIRVAFTPEMGREGAVAPRIVRSFFFVLTKPRQGIRRTNFCWLLRPLRDKSSYM